MSVEGYEKPTTCSEVKGTDPTIDNGQQSTDNGLGLCPVKG